MLVYLITNTINGKRYVGLTSLPLGVRWSLHKHRTSCPAMNAAVLKHGHENFAVEILFDGLTKQQAKEFEQEYIKRYNTRPPYGYNLTAGGDGVRDLSEETIKRISERHKGNKYALGAFRSEEYRKKLSDIFKGREFSGDWRKKMSESAKKRKASDETKKKLSEERKARGVRPPKRTSLEAAEAGRISGHKRYHINRNTVNPKCKYCTEGKECQPATQ